MGKASLLLGTGKGAFTLSQVRGGWDVTGPLVDTSPINHAIADPVTGHLHAAGGGWFGHGVWRSTDDGDSWSCINEGIALPDEEVTGVWSLARSHGRLYAGTKPAALFSSDDDGLSWSPVTGLNHHETRSEWCAGGAGMVLHHIVVHPKDQNRLWVGISVAGVFATEDGGDTWEPRNAGTRVEFGDVEPSYPEFGQCVHSLARAGGPLDVLYQQNHCGMYRSPDGGRNWTSIEAGLPSSFAFPVAVHPRDADCVWLFPLNGDVQGRFAPGGRPAIWRTRDAGASWQRLDRGLPERHAYFTVLRQAMAVEPKTGESLYFGTNTGEVWGSDDAGDNWRCIARHLPPILSVEVHSSVL
ncbi:MAG: exo-alpha-sialidase [Pseudomonadota bacterium]